ncbi:MAG: gamma carbonic anhydrase family protein [Clostridia bacterium]|nr:gamma carbonic anhydrase family protein [Clostridia bacterium]
MMMKNNFVADGAKILGDVTLGNNVSIWYNAVLRGDVCKITVGDNSNVQDCCVMHGKVGQPVVIGKGVSVGHGAILHGCTIGDNSLVGMGAVVLDGVVVGKNCIIGAGTVVTQNTIIPDNSMFLGCPAKFVKKVSDEQAESNRQNALHYVDIIKTNN